MKYKKSISLFTLILVCGLILYTYQKKHEDPGSPKSFERLKKLVLDEPAKRAETVANESKREVILTETEQQFQGLTDERQALYEDRQAFLDSLSEGPASEQVIGSRRMYMAHHSLRKPEINDADSDTNKRILEAMARKAIARREAIRQAAVNN